MANGKSFSNTTIRDMRFATAAGCLRKAFFVCGQRKLIRIAHIRIMLTRKQKQEVIDKLAEKFTQAKSAVFVDYKTITVSQMKALRRKLKEAGAELKVAKKTLFDLAMKKAKLENVSAKKMEGQIAVAFGHQDEVSAAKTLGNFAKKNEGLKIVGEILEGRFLDKAQAVVLSRVPTREQSLAMLVSVLQGNMRSLVYILSEIKK